MKNKVYLNAGIALLATLELVACNGGNSSLTSNNTTQTSELQQYINSLAYTPAGGKQLTGSVVTRQQSFSTPGELTINSVDIKFYSGANCTGIMVNNKTLVGPVTPGAGTYTSTNASNNALCSAYTNATILPVSGGCSGLYTDMSKGNMRSVQYTYHLDGGTDIVAACMYNPNAVVTIGEDTITGVEGIANWTNAEACSGSGNTTCGYSQSYAVTLRRSQFAYITNNESNNYTQCAVTRDGIIESASCTNITPSGSGALNVPTGIAFIGNYAYINNGGGNSYTQCAVGALGIESATCNTITPTGAGALNVPGGITFYGNYGYIANVDGNSYTQCSVDSSERIFIEIETFAV